MTRVVHTGDTHLGYRQYHEDRRRQDFLTAFRAVVTDAVAADVDAVVHAGDLFHDRRPELADVLGCVEALRELQAADIPFLAVVGNHEGTRSTQWLDLLERLGLAERLGTEGRVVGDLTLYGLDYTPEARRPALEHDYAEPATDHTALVSHGAFQPFEYGDWDLARVLDAASVDFDVALLGDNHAPERATVRETPAVYCGSTERTSAEERDARGYNIVEFDADAAPRIRRRGLETREFVFVDVELGPGEGGDRVRARLREEELADAVVVVTVTGDGERVVPAEIEAVGEEAGALVTRVNDRRERSTPDTELDVSFADPDEAVRERVAAMGLSDLARDVDALVRDETVADAALRERITDRVADAVDDPAAFARADTDTTASRGADPSATASEDDDGAAGTTTGTTRDDGDGGTDGGETAPDTTDGQVTMEDYL